MKQRIPDINSDQELGKWIWQNLVPKSGQSRTIQGELLRANEKLRDESFRNGNMNWGAGFELLIDFLENTLCEKRTLFKDPSKSLRKDLKRLRDYEDPYLEDDLFDRIEGCIFEFCRTNKDLLAHKINEALNI